MTTDDALTLLSRFEKALREYEYGPLDSMRDKALSNLNQVRRELVRALTATPSSPRELVHRARQYLQMNAAESGADVLIEDLADSLERLIPSHSE